MNNAQMHLKGIKFLLECGIRVVDLIPKSPDLNIIENVWAMFPKIIISKLRHRFNEGRATEDYRRELEGGKNAFCLFNPRSKDTKA